MRLPWIAWPQSRAVHNRTKASPAQTLILAKRMSCVLIETPRNRSRCQSISDGRLFLPPIHYRRMPSSLCTTVARTTTPTDRTTEENTAVPRPTRRGQYMRQHISRPFSPLHVTSTMPVRATRFGVRGGLAQASRGLCKCGAKCARRSVV